MTIRILTGLPLLLLLTVARAEVTWPPCKPRTRIFQRVELDNNATILDLHDCQIKRIETGDFDGLPNLDAIRLYNNQIEDLDPIVFNSVPNITKLYLDDNKLRVVPNFKTLPYLTDLGLTSNLLTFINDSTTFSGNTRLEILYLSFNSIEYIHPELFKHLTNLRELYLNNNKITVISEITFQIKTLERLTLENNNIEYVPPGAFKGAKLDGLRVDFNRISYLPAKMATELRMDGARLESFRFSYNSWHCACLVEQVVEVKRLAIRDYDTYWDPQLDGSKPCCKFVGTSCHRQVPSE